MFPQHCPVPGLSMETYLLMTLIKLFMKRFPGPHKNLLIYPKNTPGRKYQIKFFLQVKTMWKLIKRGLILGRIVFVGDVFSSAMAYSVMPEFHRTGRHFLCQSGVSMRSCNIVACRADRRPGDCHNTHFALS